MLLHVGERPIQHHPRSNWVWTQVWQSRAMSGWTIETLLSQSHYPGQPRS